LHERCPQEVNTGLFVLACFMLTTDACCRAVAVIANCYIIVCVPMGIFVLGAQPVHTFVFQGFCVASYPKVLIIIAYGFDF